MHHPENKTSYHEANVARVTRHGSQYRQGDRRLHNRTHSTAVRERGSFCAAARAPLLDEVPRFPRNSNCNALGPLEVPEDAATSNPPLDLGLGLMPKSPGVRVLEAGKLASAPPAGAVPANPREGPPILDADAGAVVFLATPAPWPEDNLGCRCFFPGMAPAEAVEEVDPRATACLPAGTSAESPSMAAVSASEINSGTPMDERRETLPVGAACAGTGSRRGEEGEEERRLFASTPAPSTSPSSRLARLCLLSGLRDASCIFNEEISESRVASMVSRSCTCGLQGGRGRGSVQRTRNGSSRRRREVCAASFQLQQGIFMQSSGLALPSPAHQNTLTGFIINYEPSFQDPCILPWQM